MAYEFKDPNQVNITDEERRQSNPFGTQFQPSLSGTPGGQNFNGQPIADSGGNGTGRFVNFERYLNANLDTANRTANNLAGDVEKRAAGASSAIDTAVNAQKGRIANSSMSYNGEGLQSTGPLGQTGLVAGSNGYVESGYGMNPSGGWISPEEAQSRSTAQMNVGSITGSQEYANAAKAAGKANTLMDATKSNAGIQGLLQQHVKDAGRSDGYTQGMNRFDGALVGGVGNQRFADQRKRYGNLEQMLSGAVSADDAARKQAADNTATAASQYKAMYDRWMRDEEERKKREADQAEVATDPSLHYTFR